MVLMLVVVLVVGGGAGVVSNGDQSSNQCMNKTALPQTTVLCFISRPDHRVSIGHIKLSDKVKK